MNLRILAKVLFWGCTGLVCWLSVLPPPELPPIDIWDKASHAVAYAALMLLGGFGYRPRLPLLQIALLLFGFGVAIEFVQYLLPDRSFSLLDMVANGIGILAALPLVIPTERVLRVRMP